MIFHFVAMSKIVLECKPGDTTSVMQHCDVKLETSRNLDRKEYIDGRGMPRKNALRPLISALVHGLVSCIKWAVKQEWATEEDLRTKINEELDRGLKSETGLSEGQFTF